MAPQRRIVLECNVCKIEAVYVLDVEGRLEQVMCSRCGAEVHGIETAGLALDILKQRIHQEGVNLALAGSLTFHQGSESSGLPLTPLDDLIERFSIRLYNEG